MELVGVGEADFCFLIGLVLGISGRGQMILRADVGELSEVC